MNERSNDTPIPADLEARVVALVLGEVSDDERDQLLRLIQDRPELASLKAQFEYADGLLSDVGTGEFPTPDDDWRLPEDKRAKVLSAISGSSSQRPTNLGAVAATSQPESSRVSAWTVLARTAAVLCVVAFGGSMLLVSSGRSAQRLARIPAAELSDPSGAMKAFTRVEPADRVDPSSGSGDGGSRRAAPSTTDFWQDGGLNFFSDTNDNVVPRESSRELFGAESPLSRRRQRVAAQRGESSAETSGQLRGGTVLSYGNEMAPQPDGMGGGMGMGMGMSMGGVSMGSMGMGGMGMGMGGRVEETVDLGSVADGMADTDAVAGFPARRPRAAGEELGRASRGVPILGKEVLAPAGGRTAGVTGANPPLGESAPAETWAGSGFAEDQYDRDFSIPDSGIVDWRALSLRRQFRPERAPLALEAKLPGLGDRSERVQRESVLNESLAELTEGESFDRLRRAEATQTRNDQSDLGRLNRQLDEDLEPADQSHDLKIAQDVQQRIVTTEGLQETDAAQQPVSTFSFHVSDVSFKLAQTSLSQGQWPDPSSVRIEDFVNAFDYGDPLPRQDEKISCRLEQSSHPFAQQRNLLRVSMRTAAEGRASDTPLRLTFLLDNSGSMERVDRQETVRSAFRQLAQHLKPIDQVTLISFARQPRLLADRVNGAEASRLVDVIDQLPSEGGTNIGAALQLGLEKAQEQQLEGIQNRIILITDGAVNLGDANPESLSQVITSIRQSGIAFDAAGVGADGLNDEVLERLTRVGHGRYYLLNSRDDADDGFANQVAGALRPSAENVKVQVEFNPERVGQYRLLGFEKHRLNEEDFRDDNVDAAEMAAAEAGVAVYQFQPKPDGDGDVGSVSVRFQDVSTGQMVENRWPIPYQANAPRLDQAASSMRVAAAAALLAAKLRGEPLGDSVDLKTLSELASGLPEQDRNSPRVQQLEQMIGQARQVLEN